jgi:hypothetical protein
VTVATAGIEAEINSPNASASREQDRTPSPIFPHRPPIGGPPLCHSGPDGAANCTPRGSSLRSGGERLLCPIQPSRTARSDRCPWSDAAVRAAPRRATAESRFHPFTSILVPAISHLVSAGSRERVLAARLRSVSVV